MLLLGFLGCISALAAASNDRGVTTTGRQVPHKIFPKGWRCRQCGYRADDLLGRPYSLLLGPSPELSLTSLLQRAFSSKTRLMYPAVYFTKSGLPWQAELTLSPLVESVGPSNYFVHLLRPSAVA